MHLRDGDRPQLCHEHGAATAHGILEILALFIELGEPRAVGIKGRSAGTSPGEGGILGADGPELVELLPITRREATAERRESTGHRIEHTPLAAEDRGERVMLRVLELRRPLYMERDGAIGGSSKSGHVGALLLVGSSGQQHGGVSVFDNRSSPLRSQRLRRFIPGQVQRREVVEGGGDNGVFRPQRLLVDVEGVAYTIDGLLDPSSAEYWALPADYQPAGGSCAAAIAIGNEEARSLGEFIDLANQSWGPGCHFAITGCVNYQGDRPPVAL